MEVNQIASTSALLESVTPKGSGKIHDNTARILGKIVDFYHLPDWMQKDAHITRGYRTGTKSFRACFHSLWYLHNESVDTWSHLISGTAFLAMLLWSFLPALHGQSDTPAGPLHAARCQLVATTICLYLSAFYHCVSCHSFHVSKICLKLDYLGIVLNISFTWISAIYFGLYGHRELTRWYITQISICACITFWVMLSSKMDGPQTALWRSITFLSLGASGFAPMIHAALMDHISLKNFPLFYMITSTILFLTGTAVYVTRTPEKYWPGVFDVWGAGNQIFHVLVNIAQISHILGLIEALTKLSEISN
ncbi:hypothetical protein BOTCAL_0014g00520 [Botryotinia calthae]|uniref:Uncharacterized protein n=1 Tax=Botryotinia calthae TaxID=38488 RepID=A0A4Y8DFS4_9HELO|nr:hypothetical protein BOTCAL_0014g00520 [Botryotinia calthae]